MTDSPEFRTGARVRVRSPQTRVTAATPHRRVLVAPLRGPAGADGAAGGAEVAQALADHIAAENPHPTYDQMLDLELLYENGLI